MTPHIHIGLAEFLVVALMTLIFSFFWRWVIALSPDKPITRGMAAVYS
jgi:hypothetical protein